MPKKSQAEQRHDPIEPVAEDGAFDDPLEDRFFSATSLAPVELELASEALAEAEMPERAGPAHPRAMLATLAMMVVALVGIGGFLIYHKVLMPTPVTLGGSAPVLPLPQVPPPDAEPVIARAPTPAQQPPPAPELETAPADELGEPPEPQTAPEPVPAEASAAARPSQAPLRKRRHRAPRARKPRTALARLAFTSLNRGDFGNAERLAAQATVVHPQDADGWMVLAAARDALGDAAGAQRAYRMCGARVSGRAGKHCRRLAR